MVGCELRADRRVVLVLLLLRIRDDSGEGRRTVLHGWIGDLRRELAWVLLLLHLRLLLTSSVVVDLLLRAEVRRGSELGLRVFLSGDSCDSCHSSDDFESLWKKKERKDASRSQRERRERGGDGARGARPRYSRGLTMAIKPNLCDPSGF